MDAGTDGGGTNTMVRHLNPLPCESAITFVLELTVHLLRISEHTGRVEPYTCLMSSSKERSKIEVHEGTGLENFYERLRFTAATKLQPWDEIQPAKGSHYVKVAGLRIHIADREGIESSFQRDFDVVNTEAIEDSENRIVRMIDYPRLCKKTIIAKHLGLTTPKLKKLLGEWGYEHVRTDEYRPEAYLQMVIVKTALLCAERKGINARIPVRQESITELFIS